MISHIEAQALISARMDGPLDPIAERELQAHIATCDTCRAFANQTAAMTRAFHELPYLPASPSVSRVVMEHVQRPSSMWGMTQQWLTPNLGSALSTVAALVVVAALGIFVLTRIVGQGGNDGHQNNTQVLTAPSQETGNGLALNNLTPTATVVARGSGQGQPTTVAATAKATTATATNTVAPTNVAVAPTATSPVDTAPGPTSTSTAGADNGQIVVPTEATTVEPTAVATSEQKQALGGADQSGRGAARTAAGASTAVPLPTWTPLPTFTAAATATTTPSPTDTPVPEPTSTPTETPTPEPTLTAEPTATLVPTETPAPESTATPTSTSTSTPLPTAEPTQTPVPTQTPMPTATVSPEPTQTPSPTENAQVIEPANGAVEAGGPVPTSVVGEVPPTGTETAPTAASNQPTIAGNDNTGGGGQVIVPATGEQASPNLSETPVPASTSPEIVPTSPAGEQVIVPKGGDNQRGGRQEAPTEATPLVVENGGNPTATPPTGGSAPEGDLSAATVQGSLNGGASDRLVYANGSAGVSSEPDAAPMQSADGVRLQEEPGKNGTSVFACSSAGTCVDATSGSAEGAHTDAAIGWVDGHTMIYQRMLANGSYQYRAANVTAAGEASGDQLIGSGGTEFARSGSAFAFRDGLLVEANGGWVVVTSQQAQLQPSAASGPRTLVRVFNSDPVRVAYVSGGMLVIQNVYSADVTTLPFNGVDYDLSPNGDQVVVSTGSVIEMLDLSGQVTFTFQNAQNISVGSVLWLNNTIEFVDLTSGEIRSIDVP